MLWSALRIALDMDQRIVSTRHITGLIKNILVLSIHIAATATNYIDLAISLAPSRACVLKPSIICIAGWLPKNTEWKVSYYISYCPRCDQYYLQVVLITTYLFERSEFLICTLQKKGRLFACVYPFKLGFRVHHLIYLILDCCRQTTRTVGRPRATHTQQTTRLDRIGNLGNSSTMKARLQEEASF